MNQNIELENLKIYKEIVEHISESLWIWDMNNKTVYVNNIFCDITWYLLEEIIWKNYSVFFEKEYKPNKLKYETNIITKSWTMIPVSCNWKKTTNWWFVFTFNDLSELKFLKKAKQDLIKLNKTKDEFISIVGHELRTPLTSIRWYLSMILEWDMWEVNNDIKKSLNHSYNSSVRLIKLVNDILSIWKIESWKMEYYIKNVWIKKIINSVYKDIHLEIEHKWIDFRIEFDENLENSIINTDEDKLKQVFLNLLTNSLKFTEKWKEIILKATKVKNKVQFEIIDTWTGIPKDKLNMLFSKFSQVESSLQRQNTSWLGLGLAICKNFIQEFESEIKVKSKVWKWSNFYFDLEIKK